MKIKPEHYQKMKDAIAPLAEKAKSHRNWIEQESKAKDIEKRLRWDLARAANLIPFICDELYPSGLNDDHVDTALRNIVKDLSI